MLVVDDNAINRKVAVLLLAKLGVKADTAANGREALAAIERFPYSLVLMDYHMPEMDGLAACRELRRLEAGRRRLPVLAMTADGGDDQEACREAGMDGSVAKPIRSEDLQKALREWTAPVGQADVRRIEEMVGEDAEALTAVVGEFVEAGVALTEVMRTATREADRGALSMAAHGLKGAALSFGALPLALFCSRLEALAAAGQVMSCGAFVEAAAQEFERTRRALGGLSNGGFRPA